MKKQYALFILTLLFHLGSMKTDASEILLNIQSLNNLIEEAYNDRDLIKLEKLMTEELFTDLKEDFDRDEINTIDLSISVEDDSITFNNDVKTIIGSWIYNKKSGGGFLERKCIFKYRKNGDSLILIEVLDIKDAFMLKIFEVGKEALLNFEKGNFMEAKKILINHGADTGDVDLLIKSIDIDDVLKFDGVNRDKEGAELVFKINKSKYLISFKWESED
jgi:hypothetical protein